jgi:hypothetical protein
VLLESVRSPEVRVLCCASAYVAGGMSHPVKTCVSVVIAVCWGLSFVHTRWQVVSCQWCDLCRVGSCMSCTHVLHTGRALPVRRLRRL